MFVEDKYEYGPTGGLFDFDRDGKLDFFEKTREYEFMESFLNEEKDEDEDDYDLDLDDDLDNDDLDLDDDDFKVHGQSKARRITNVWRI